MGKNKNISIKSYIASPLMNLLFLAVVAITFAFVLKDTVTGVFLFLLIIVDFICKLLFILLSDKHKNKARHLSLFLMGIFVFALGGLLSMQNLHIEGLLFFIFAGVAGGTLIHFINAKIVGPIFLGRNWCAWGCWTPMILDLLPYKINTERKNGIINKIKYIYLFIAIIVIAFLVYGLNYTIHPKTPESQGNILALYWFAIGNLIYYTAGIILAIILKDNRAFCKYLCPTSIIMKVTGSFSLLKIKGKKEICNQCNNCVRVCMMNIDLPKYIHSDKRITSNECIMCLKCIPVCKRGALSASIGLDISTKNNLTKTRN